MAVVEGYDRGSSEYLQFLEDEYCRQKKAEERDAKTGILGAGAGSVDPDIKHSLDEVKDAL